MQFVVVLLWPLLSRGRVMLHSVMLLCLHNIGDNTIRGEEVEEEEELGRFFPTSAKIRSRKTCLCPTVVPLSHSLRPPSLAHMRTLSLSLSWESGYCFSRNVGMGGKTKCDLLFSLFSTEKFAGLLSHSLLTPLSSLPVAGPANCSRRESETRSST